MPLDLDLDGPSHDPDGAALMASLRQRIAAAPRPVAPTVAFADQYRPALVALQALLGRRKALGAAPDEIEALEAVAGRLRALAGGLK